MAADLDSRGGTTRRRILEALGRHGAATLQQIADEVGITRMGVHQHLRALASAELVRVDVERGGVGRPRHRYALTDAAKDLFPQHYDAFAVGLLEDAKRVGGEELLDRLFREGCARLEERYRPRVEGRPLRERVRAVAEILEESGFMADWQQVDDRTFVIREHNCAIYRVAERNGVACKYELVLLTRLLRADVSRERHIASGDETCTYVVRARDV